MRELDELIEQLPDNFPDAVEPIKNEIASLIAECDAGLKDHYVTTIKKKTNAASKPAVKHLIEDAIKQMNKEQDSEAEMLAEESVDPEVAELAENIARDPLLFKKRIDLVNQLGVIGEQRTIGLYTLVLDSALLPLGSGGSEALAAKNSGPYGAGKSYPLFVTLKIYPKSAYRLITNGSAKSLYNLKDGLKHKALILTEALSLQGTTGDNELAYAIRSLVSEGQLTYQYTGFEGKEKVTITQKIEGPTSLLTTTIRGKLEDQLEDRLVQIHPNSSDKQTQNIIERTAELASGNFETVDEKTISAWKLFNQSLIPVEVVIPYSKDIASFVSRNRSLPISVRRAFKRVLSAVKTIALLYQKQRHRDDLGRVIAEFSDYAIAVQLINDSFMESIGEGKRYTDDRIQIIDKHGMMSSKDLAKITGVSVSAISMWMKSLINKGILTWCDEEGEEFPDVKLLEKAKRSGKAYIKVANHNCLPTPFELTGNPDWDIEGELYRQYDLGIESTDTDILDLDEGEQSSFSLNTSADSYDVGNKEESEDSTEGVNALRSIPHEDVMKMVAELKENQEEYDSKDPELIKFQNDLVEIITPDNVSAIN